MRRFCSFAFVVGLAACAPGEAPETGLQPHSILYGEPVQVGDFPSVGFVATFENGRSVGTLCTATLIAEDTVLTAAHCIEDALPSQEVYFARDLTAFLVLDFASDRWSRAAGWSLHPAYVPAGGDELIANDIALIFLEAPVEGVEIPAVAGAETAPRLRVGAPVTLVGYGRDETGLSGPLRKAKSVISFVDDDVVRTGGVPPAPSRCSGDSGGPTFMTVDDGLAPSRRVISVNSFGLRGCESSSTEARVDAYLDWIWSTMEGACTDETRVAAVCAADPGPRRVEAAPELDAGTPSPPSVGPVPDAGVVDVTVRPPGEGCRCLGGPRGAPWLALLLGLWGFVRRRR